VSPPDVDLSQEAVIIRAGWINTVLISGVLLAGAISLIRYNRGSDFELLNIKLPISIFPFACGAYTIGHIYCTWLFVEICAVSRQEVPGQSASIWKALTLKGPLIFAGMLPRHQIFEFALPFGRSVSFYEIPSEDPTLWLFYGFCFAIFFAFKWSCSIAGYSKKIALLLTWSLLAVNWVAGSIWTDAASQLLSSR
jgi:hypothetical protein